MDWGLKSLPNTRFSHFLLVHAGQTWCISHLGPLSHPYIESGSHILHKGRSWGGERPLKCLRHSPPNRFLALKDYPQHSPRTRGPCTHHPQKYQVAVLPLMSFRLITRESMKTWPRVFSTSYAAPACPRSPQKMTRSPALSFNGISRPLSKG